jgi:hypothetical protein
MNLNLQPHGEGRKSVRKIRNEEINDFDLELRRVPENAWSPNRHKVYQNLLMAQRRDRKAADFVYAPLPKRKDKSMAMFLSASEIETVKILCDRSRTAITRRIATGQEFDTSVLLGEVLQQIKSYGALGKSALEIIRQGLRSWQYDQLRNGVFVVVGFASFHECFTESKNKSTIFILSPEALGIWQRKPSRH